MNYLSVFEWLSIISTILIGVFGAGVSYNIVKNKSNKVDNYEHEIDSLYKKIESVSTKISLIESDLSQNKVTVHKLANELSSFKIEISKRLEANDKKQLVMLMLLENLCKANNVETTMGKFIIEQES